MKKIIVLLFASVFGAVTLITTTGCESINNVVDVVEENEILIQGTVQYASLKYIDGESDKAVKLKERVSDIRKKIDVIEKHTTVVRLVELANEQIPWEEMKPEDVVAVRTLMAVIENQIDYDIETGYLDPKQISSVVKILDWVEEAADLYLSGATQEEILGTYKAQSEVVETDTWPVFHFVTGARNWDDLVAWWNAPATIEEVEEVRARNLEVGLNSPHADTVNQEYEFWAMKHGL